MLKLLHMAEDERLLTCHPLKSSENFRSVLNPIVHNVSRVRVSSILV